MPFKELKKDSSIFNEDYQEVNAFINQYNHCSLMDFDYHLTNDFHLYTSYEHFDYLVLENNLDLIIANFPVILRIASHPIIRLKDHMETLPVESVFKIDNKTMMNIANHSELWEDYDEDMITPKKLLTYTSVDEFAIYENVGFVYLTHLILNYVKHHLRIFKDMLYTNKILKFNVLERIHHTYYFLAIGKLETGYLKNLDYHYDSIYRILNKLNLILNTLKAHLVYPIYKKVKIPHAYHLKKTNIFLHHKDYKRIYRLLKHFMSLDEEINLPKVTQTEEDSSYLYYLKIITVFSIEHFNFKLINKKIDFEHFNLSFTFKQWNLNIKDFLFKNKECLLLTIYKETTYKILLIPYDESFKKEVDKKTYDVNEILYLSYFEDNKDDVIYISNNNLNSFQRIQQIILKAMIYCDTKKETCPFCGSPLNQHTFNNHPVWICSTCHNKISLHYCSEAKKNYFTTEIDQYKINKDDFVNDEFLYSRFLEGMMYYRNITKIDTNLDPICPFCKKKHE